jgi:penicillin-binding protein 1A
VPQAEPQQPPGVTAVDGELFFTDMMPGNGFVASIGLDSANPVAGTDAVGGVGPAGMTPPTVPPPSVSSNEKKQIMDLFESNKP